MWKFWYVKIMAFYFWKDFESNALKIFLSTSCIYLLEIKVILKITKFIQLNNVR